MADAILTGDKQHGGRQMRSEDGGIVQCAAGGLAGTTTGMGKQLAKMLIHHHRWLIFGEREIERACARTNHQLFDLFMAHGKCGGFRASQIDREPHCAGYDIHGVGQTFDSANGCNGRWAGIARDRIDAGDHFRQCNQWISAIAHRGAAGMVGRAHELALVLLATGDRGDHRDGYVRLPHGRALLGVDFDQAMVLIESQDF